ncbi:MAG: sulfotransferase [Actinobacteria bacterium]|nr:sulfotransferase [Actinomycetota bacterium]
MTTGDRRPLFVLSLPRSGSTLTQRVLAAHEEVATTPEPWLLLPLVYATRERGLMAEYNHVLAARAIREFADRLPGGPEGYDAELRRFALSLYDRASGGKGRFFLDKTPRYHFVIEDLFRLFPEAGFVFLWRNPLAVVASIVETWGRGTWSVERWRVDLFDGVSHLVAGYQAHADQAHAVRFEDLVADPLSSWPPLFEHLGLSFDEQLLSSFVHVDLGAQMGDPTGTARYRSLSTEPLDKWKQTLASPLRKRWAGRYLSWIGRERLGVMGYDLEELRRELDAIPSRPRRIGSDVAHAAYWWADRRGRKTAARLLWHRPSR